MQANNGSKKKQEDFEKILCEINPGYNNTGYCYFLFVPKDDYKETIKRLEKEAKKIGLQSLEIVNPFEMIKNSKTIYEIEIRIK